MSKEWLGIFNALLLHATKSYNWEQVNDTDLTPDECAAACYEIYEQWLNTGNCPTQLEPPYWEDADDVDDDDDDGIPWYDELGDWFLTGFLAVTFTPTAGIFYKTFVPKARVALRRGDWGSLFKVLIGGLEYVTGDSYSAITDILEIDLDIEGFAAANGLGAAPWDLQIIHNGTGASTDPNPRLEVVRKRLDANEVTAITDIFQDQGQLLIQRGNIDVWYNVENADNVRRDGSTTIIGQQKIREGAASNALLKLNPNVGEKAIEIQLPVTTEADVFRILNSSGTSIFLFNSLGKFIGRGTDNAMFSVRDGSGVNAFVVGTSAANPIVTFTGRATQSADILRVLSSTAVLYMAIGSTGIFTGRGTIQHTGATSTTERIMASMVSTWDVTTDATRRAKTVFNINTWLGTVTPLAMSADNTGAGTLGFFGASLVPQQAVNEGVVDLSLVFLQALQSLKNLGLIKPAGGGAFTFTKQVVTADTEGNQALQELLDGLDIAGLITNNSVSEQSFGGTLTPINGPTSVAWASPKVTIVGETYTITATGLISFAAGANGYSDPIWEGTPSNNLTGSAGTRGEFKVDGVFQGGTEAPEMTGHAYTLDPFAGTGSTVLFQFSDYIADPTGQFDITITGKFAN